MRSRGGYGPPAAAAPPFPWQFAIRAVAVISGLVLLLIVDVKGAAFYFAWSLVVLALVSEGAATAVHWRRSRRELGSRRR